ncbi:hypothetical protein M9H77_22539 [Catharanthus roseus]|uniref:Uncharacterized protein n=1 Tax=Catharanthus roseus TaxID=4058 RepID=A0ACC0ARH0_CATRO|nr:hypothetical protein M9H77_22539 [Catharanthus roseus]
MALSWQLMIYHPPGTSTLDVIGTTRVYIRNIANRDTRTVGYQPTGVDRRMMEVDDMATEVIQGSPSSPTEVASFAKKVQTIIRRCMVSTGGTLGCTPSQQDIHMTFLVQPSRCRPRELVPDRGRHEHVDPEHEVERDEESGGRGHVHGHVWASHHVDLFDSPDLDMPSFSLGLTPPSMSLPGFSSFLAPPLPGTADSSTPYQPILYESSSDEEANGWHDTYTAAWIRTSCWEKDYEIQQHSILITQDISTINTTKCITAVKQMVSDEPSMLYPTVNDNDDEIDQSDGDDVVSSQFESDDDNNPKEGELQTPINPLTENIVPQWESSQ